MSRQRDKHEEFELEVRQGTVFIVLYFMNNVDFFQKTFEIECRL